jgi:hypothetical protein
MILDPELLGRFLVLLLFIGPPFWAILGKIGRSRIWLFLLLIPVLGTVVLLWFVAFAKWPGDYENSYIKELH